MNEQTRYALQDSVQDLTERYQAAGYFADASVRVFDAQETLCIACAGSAREDSWFDVASLTKIATATQVLLLISQGRLSLDTLLTAELPEISADPFLREQMAGITLRKLLTHTSGLPAWFPFYTERDKDFFTVLPLALQREGMTEGMVYSDLNFMLLGKLLERVRGKPLERCLREDLAEPYHLGGMTCLPEGMLDKIASGNFAQQGMADHSERVQDWACDCASTSFPEKLQDIIPSSYGNPIEREMCAERGLTFAGFRPEDRPVQGEANDGNCWYYFHGVAGHAGIFARTEAYARLCQLYLTTKDPLLREALREQPGAPGRGLGFQTGLSYPHGCGHTGFTGTGIYLSRELNIGVVSFTNRLFVRRKCEGQTWEYRRALQEMVAAYARMK